jgi:hypothetical protein
MPQDRGQGPQGDETLAGRRPAGTVEPFDWPDLRKRPDPPATDGDAPAAEPDPKWRTRYESPPGMPERLKPSPGVVPGGGHRSAAAPPQPPPQPPPPARAEPDPSPRPTPVGPAGGRYPVSARPRPEPAPPRPSVAAQARRGPRRARLTVRRVDPWSVLKFTFVFSLAVMVVLVVAAVVLYGVLSAMGVFHSVNSFVHTLNGSNGGSNLITFPRAVVAAFLVGVVNVVLFTALATLGALVYNLCSEIVGGIEVTLGERE